MREVPRGQRLLPADVHIGGGSAGSTPQVSPRCINRGTGTGGAAFSRSLRKEHPFTEPPKAGAFHRRPIKPSEFRRFYDRGDLPVQVLHSATQNRISWKVEPEKL